MTRKPNALGVALVAVVAMSAIAASAAQATSAHFKMNASDTFTVEDHPQAGGQVFETDVGQIECEEFHATGQLQPTSGGETSTTAADATLTDVSYGNCNVGGLEAEVKFAPCHYTLHAGSTIAAGASTGSVDLTQTGGTTCGVEISITIGGLCTIRINPQNGLESITYTNVQTTGKPEEVTLHTFILNIEYEWEGPLCGAGADVNGYYEGTLTARATTGNLTIEDTA